MTDSNCDILLKLLKAVVGGKRDVVPKDVDWMGVLSTAEEQKVLPIAFDAIEHLPEEHRPDIDTLMEWLGQTSYSETVYESHRDAILDLANVYAKAEIKMLLLKGYGLSLNYPVPSHRPTGDIDVYLFGDGEKGDNLIKSLGIPVKQNEDKHSTFPWKDTTVENHACFISDIVHPCLQNVENVLERYASCAIPLEICNKEGKNVTIYLPSANANAIFLPLHTAVHFFHGEASIRQLCDWALFIKKYHNYIGWSELESIVKKAGYYPFYCCLNGIVIDYLGIPEEYFPKWPRNRQLEKKVLNEILLPKTDNRMHLLSKVIRFFNGYWKYRLIFNENILLASIRQAQSYLLIKGHKKGENLWDIKKKVT